MDSATQLGLAGIGGTLVAAVVGVTGSLRQTALVRRGAADAEDQKARRQAFGSCATALMARRDAVNRLRRLLPTGRADPATVDTLLAEIESLRVEVARAVGAVMVEGPTDVAHRAEWAARGIESAAARCRDWVAEALGGRDLSDLRAVHGRYIDQDRDDMEQRLGDFVEECRKALHPHDG